MTSELPVCVKILLLLLAASLTACLLVSCGSRLTRLWRQATVGGRTAFVFAILMATLFAGTKPSPAPATARPPSFAASQPPGFATLVSVATNANCDYSRPSGAMRNERWFAHGARDAWCRIDLAPFVFPLGADRFSSFSVFTDGTVRPTPRDAAHALGLATLREDGGARRPMLALAGASELWHDEGPCGCHRITWRAFHPNADTNEVLSCQLVLFPNGDFIVRSNELAYAYARIDAYDWDGDGIPNSLDDAPNRYDGNFFGPSDALPTNANTGCYYEIGLRAPCANAEVVFVGDGPSDLPDAHFMARAGETCYLPLLLGKTYRVTASQAIVCDYVSDDEAEVTRLADNALEIVRPVYVYPGNGLHDFSMFVDPPGLGGAFAWTNSCCAISSSGDNRFAFVCNRCGCGGCTAAGYYGYEGYRLSCWGGECHCDPTDPDADNNQPDGASLYVPECVFLNNDAAMEAKRGESEDDLRAIAFSLPSPEYRSPDDGTVTFRCTAGAHRIRLWETDVGTGEKPPAQIFPSARTAGDVYYLEGVETSGAPGDVTFELGWTDNEGRAQSIVRHTTVALVTNVLVTSSAQGASPNPPPFPGQCENLFDVTNSRSPSKHLVIPFKNVANDDLSVRDFDVDIELQLLPAGFSLAYADVDVTRLGDTPAVGYFHGYSNKRVTFSNPKVGGVYRFGLVYGGSPESQCTIVLPLAGARCDTQITNDFQRCQTVVTNVCDFMRRKRISSWNSYYLGRHLFWNAGHGDYLGRPDNPSVRMAWRYNQVNDKNGMGAACTWFGHPVPLAKASNFLTGYSMRKMGTPKLLMAACQIFGEKFNGFTEDLFDAAIDMVDKNTSYTTAVSNAVRAVWRKRSEKVDFLWPGPMPASNHVRREDFHDPNKQYSSPGFLNFETDEDLDYEH